MINSSVKTDSTISFKSGSTRSKKCHQTDYATGRASAETNSMFNRGAPAPNSLNWISSRRTFKDNLKTAALCFVICGITAVGAICLYGFVIGPTCVFLNPRQFKLSARCNVLLSRERMIALWGCGLIVVSLSITLICASWYPTKSDDDGSRKDGSSFRLTSSNQRSKQNRPNHISVSSQFYQTPVNQQTYSAAQLEELKKLAAMDIYAD